jgi:hypothetical protein
MIERKIVFPFKGKSMKSNGKALDFLRTSLLEKFSGFTEQECYNVLRLLKRYL